MANTKNTIDDSIQISGEIIKSLKYEYIKAFPVLLFLVSDF